MKGNLEVLREVGFETPADVKKYKNDGAHAVGMSTAPEVETARWRGMRVAGLTALSNVVGADDKNATEHEAHLFVLERPSVQKKLS
ncbi:MAG: hypothetical protein ACE5FT_05775 [Candidatus Nanoarchaeia archaeon]